MIDYLKDYKIVPKSHTFEPDSIKFDKDRYQIIKFDEFLFCVDKQSDLVFKFKDVSPYRTDKIYVAIMKKNRVICEHFYFVASDLKHTIGTQIWQWYEHFVYLVQTSFYVLLDKRERNDVVNYLKNKPNSTVRVQSLNNSSSYLPRYVFVSLDIYNYKFNPLKTEIFASLNTNADGRLMVSSDSALLMCNITSKLVKRYAIKRIQHYNSLNNDVHYYEVTLASDNFGRVMILYDMNKKKATFSFLTYLHGEPVIKKRHVVVEPDKNYQVNILNELERTYLGQYPSAPLIEHFKEWHMDISNGLKEDHLTVLEMFEI
jgi:hypothetical protein